ncbi:MAG: DUF2304 domain-containing protein [Candidatus Marinimicrobia bacterium]|nr:DUF2304 domain-containing protein [Candidatus Neomarinimicrobiota bacterium]
MTLPQSAAVLTGCLIVALSAYCFLQWRTRRFQALFWAAIGAAMVYAGFRPAFIEWLGPDSLELRLRLIVALLSFIVLTITLETIRIARLQERYAFLWLLAGLLLLGGALLPDLARALVATTGLSYGVIVLVIIFTFLLLMLFHFSVALSRTQFKLAQLTRELALAEERLRRLETPRPPAPALPKPE